VFGRVPRYTASTSNLENIRLEVGKMNHVLAGDWKQLRGQIKEWWGKLTKDDRLKIEGKYDKLVGAVQVKYGHTKERAIKAVNRRFAHRSVDRGRRLWNRR
jgi:uncharacterized protein YjbJ (UPF0337 family)